MELKAIGIRWEENGELHFSHVYLKSEVDEAITELKQKLEEKDKDIAELKKENARLKDELDAANNQCENLINSATDIMLRQDKVNDTKCAEIESLKASHYAEMVDAGMRERRLKRALWLARAERAECKRLDYYHQLHLGIHQPLRREVALGEMMWRKVERKCRAMAERYGEVK